MNLAQAQALFYSLVTQNVAAASDQALEACFVGSAERPAADRVNIYANMYLSRLVDALRADFPKLLALLGEACFFELGAAYARSHPSEHYDIGRFGRLLSAFLHAHPELALRPDAVDLAELEWARAEVFVEATSAALARETLADLLAQNPTGARITLVPGIRVLRLAHDVVPLFRHLDDGTQPSEPSACPTALVVWRPKYEVFHARLATDESTALELARRAATLAEICAAFTGAEDPVRAAFDALSSWADEGFIAAREA